MVDVVRAVGNAEQLRAIAELRWRMLVNTVGRYGGWAGMAGAGLFATVMIIPFSLWFGITTYRALAGGRPDSIADLFWVAFALWQVAPVLSAGAETHFDVRSLLRFPLNLRALYVIALAAGLVEFGALASGCGLIAMGIGVWKARPDLLPAWAVTGLAFIAMNVALERLCSAWLQRLLAQRRTREVVLGLMALMGIGAQFITRYIAEGHLSAWQRSPSLGVLPPALAGRAIEAAAGARAGPAWLYAAAVAAYAAAFGALLWKRIAVQYRGEDLSETAAPAAPKAVRANGPVAGSTAPGLLPPQIGLVFRKEIRYLIRTPRLLFGLLASPLFVMFILPTDFGSPDAVFPLMAGYVFTLSSIVALNCFGADGTGVQTYFIAPVRFQDVFLGKNLSSAALVVVELALCTGLVAIRVRPPSLPVFAAVAAALVFALTAVLPIANRLSLIHPARLEARSGGVGVGLGTAALPWYAMNMALWMVGVPVFLAGRWTGQMWLPAEIFAVLAAASIVWYADALESGAELAQQRRDLLLDTLCR
ncbi:MAG TPA: hypothetical protein VFP86_17825 [bacterium]|nr:hypothetical protein [bacterium]